MDDIKYHPSAILAQITDWFDDGPNHPFECGWRLKHAIAYYKQDKTHDAHLVYCFEGLAWRFEELAKKIRNMDKSGIKETQ